MNKKIQTLDEMRPNVFEAIKRAYIKRGIVPRRYQSKDIQASEPAPAAAAKKPRKAGKSSESESDSSASQPDHETLQESVADEGESKENQAGYNNEQTSKTAKGPTTLREITKKSHDVLYEATTVFPFTLFPDSLCLDREKLTIANRTFWRTANITSVPLGEIMSAEVTVDPFFGSLHLTFRFFANNERTVSFLTRSDALELQRLIHGYIIAHRREIDTSNIKIKELKKLLYDLGQGVTD